MFLQRGSGAKGQEVRLHCSLGSARLAAAIPLSARRLDAALKGQLYPERGDAGCCCFTVPLKSRSAGAAHRKLGYFCEAKGRKSQIYVWTWKCCGVVILVPSFLISLSYEAA